VQKRLKRDKNVHQIQSSGETGQVTDEGVK